MDTSTIYERFQRMREKTQQAVCGSQELMRETRLLLEESRASCRASRALLEALEESLLIDQLNWPEPDNTRLLRIAPEPTKNRVLQSSTLLFGLASRPSQVGAGLTSEVPDSFSVADYGQPKLESASSGIYH